jgi:hypothetical protein
MRFVLSLLSLSLEKALLAWAAEQVRVIVRIDGVDVSHADGNDGPGPWDALVPVNRSWRPTTSRSRRLPAARAAA